MKEYCEKHSAMADKTRLMVWGSPKTVAPHCSDHLQHDYKDLIPSGSQAIKMSHIANQVRRPPVIKRYLFSSRFRLRELSGHSCGHGDQKGLAGEAFAIFFLSFLCVHPVADKAPHLPSSFADTATLSPGCQRSSFLDVPFEVAVGPHGVISRFSVGAPRCDR